ncbi:ATP-binding protein [Lewinellaceae bacterium SD302]|nr:ATP-binding protein [Lewinellaceae bacterium SD302]
MLQLSSDPGNIQQVTQLVDRVSQQYRLNEETHANLLISLTEAVNNAIIHGNGMDKSKTVDIEMRKRGNRLCVSVKDQGKGFNPKEVPNPTCPEQICECGGRGVFLIKELCDKVEYAENGSKVNMQFKFQ